MLNFTNKKRFNSVEQYLKYREQTKGKVPDKNTSRRILEEENINNETLSANRAYNLLMEDKKQNERNKLWWKNLKVLK